MALNRVKLSPNKSTDKIVTNVIAPETIVGYASDKSSFDSASVNNMSANP